MTVEVEDRPRVAEEEILEPIEKFVFTTPLAKILERWHTGSIAITERIEELGRADAVQGAGHDPDSLLHKLAVASVGDPRSYTPFAFAVEVVKTNGEHQLLAGTTEGDRRRFLADATDATIASIQLAMALAGNGEEYAGTTSSGGDFRIPTPSIQNITGGEPLTGQAAITALRKFKRQLRGRKQIAPNSEPALPLRREPWRTARR